MIYAEITAFWPDASQALRISLDVDDAAQAFELIRALELGGRTFGELTSLRIESLSTRPKRKVEYTRLAQLERSK